MQIVITDKFEDVSEEEFLEFLNKFNWKRDGYADGEYYCLISNKEFAPRIAIHKHNKFYINKDFLV